MKKIFDNKIFQFVEGLFRGAFIIVIGCYLVFVLLQRISGNNSVMGYRLFTVATGSMSGVYEINDVIAVKDCDVDSLKIGDDIAYQGERGGLDGLLITHRIIKIEESENGERLFTTKGVNAPAEDPVITEKQILGKVVGVVPIITLLNHIVKSQLGFFLCIFCPLVLIIVLEVLQTITDIKLEKNEIQEIQKEEYTKEEKRSIEDDELDNSFEDESEEEEDEKEIFSEESLDKSSLDDEEKEEKIVEDSEII